MAAVHGITAGTDSSSPWARLLYVATIGLVAAATAWRVLTVTKKPGRVPAERAA
jgi:hypothetical protein